MKKETSGKKSLLWLWITIAVVVVLAGTVAVLFATGVIGAKEDEKFHSELYWNVDRASWLDEESGLSMREPEADGLYHIRLAVGGEQVEYIVADGRLANKIDAYDIMCLKFDAEGNIIDVVPATDVYTIIAENVFVQNIEGEAYLFNSSQAYNGMETTLNIGSDVGVYNVIPSRVEVPGRTFKTGELATMDIMDRVTIYGTDENTPTDIFISYRPYESKVYWRVERQYDATNKCSAREMADDGYWYVDFLVDTKVETHRTKDPAVINAIDGYGLVNAYCGLVFDVNGDIVDCFNAGYAVKGKVAAATYNVTQLSEDGKTFTLTRLFAGNEAGRTFTGTIGEDTKIYNMTTTAEVLGEYTELQDGDLTCVLTDSMGNPKVIFVTNRYVDSPMYYNVSVKYDSKTKQTTRKPDADGWYTIELAVKGQLRKFRCADWEVVNQIDQAPNSCMGLKVDGNVILKYYDPACVSGNWSFGSGYFVVSAEGVILSAESTTGVVANGIMVPDCEVYDVSGHGEFKGVVTTLREGDRMVGYKNPQGEVTHVYVIARYEAGTNLYWNVSRNTNRKPDADGWYVYKMIKMGQTGYVTLKTKDAKLVKQIDTYNPAAMTLRVNSEGIITRAYNSNAFTIGYEHLSGIHVIGYQSDTGRWLLKYRTTGAEANVDMTDVPVYIFSGVYDSAPGERTTLRPGDRIECIRDRHGQLAYAWVYEREHDSNAYWLKDPVAIDTTTGYTKREKAADGYYYFTVAVNGTTKTVKTNDIEIATAVDGTVKNSLCLAFGLKLNGDVIEAVLSSISVKGIYMSGQSYYDVTAINGNTITLERLKPGSSNTGDKQVINISSAKIYEVSQYAGDKFGKATTLTIGDRVQTYIGEDGKTISYVFVAFHNTHEAGAFSYCEHCGETVFWEPYTTSVALAYIKDYSYHYYLPADCERELSTGWGVTGSNTAYDWVLDLNGFTYSATDSYAFAVRGSSTLTVLDTSSAKTGRITGVGVQIKDKDGNKSQYQSSHAGIFRVLDNGVLNLRGGTYTRTVDRDVTNLRRAGVVAIEKDTKTGRFGTLNIYDGAKLVNNTMDAPLDIATDGVTIVRRAPQGGAIYNAGGVVNIYGGLISNNGKIHADFAEFEGTAVGNGGNIFNADGELNIYGGKITNGWSRGNGGNIYVTKGKLNIAGGEISGGTSINGANNIIVAANNNTQISISGGKITGDTTISAGNTLSISGKPQITMGEKQGLFLGEGVRAQVGTMEDGAKIVISSSGVFTTDFASEAAADAMLARNIFVGASDKTPFYRDGKALASGKRMCVNGHTNADECAAAGCDKELLDWTPWESTDSLPTSGNFYLTDNVTIDARVNMAGDVTLDLNGFNVTRVIKTGATDYGVYTTNGMGDLYLTDLSGGTVGTVSTVFDTDVTTCAGTGFLAYVGAGFNLTIDKGVYDFRNIVTTNSAGTGCGPIVADGNVTINGGTFYGITAANGYGGVISGRSNSTITVNGGTLYGGKIKQGGMISSSGRIIINDGTFNGNNSATNAIIDGTQPRTEVTHGGLICAQAHNNSYLEINGGTFIAPRTFTSGGMIYVEAGNNVTKINGGTFQLSQAANGGFIRFRGKSLDITGVTLEGGKAVSGAGDIINMNSTGTLTIGQDAVIDGGIELSAAAKLVLKDNVKINAGTNYAIKLGTGTLDISGLNDEAKVHINHTDPETAFATAADEDTAKALVDNKIIVSGDPNYRVIADGKNLTVKVQIQWQEWNAAAAATAYNGNEADNLHLTKLPTAGDYKLIADVTIDARVAMTGNVNLNLNGHTATRVIKSGAADYGFYTTNAKGNLYITDEIKETDPEATVGTMQTVFDTDVTTCAGTGFLGYVGAGYTITIDEGNFDFRGVKTTASATTGVGAIIVDGTLVINGGTFYGANAGTTGYGTVIGGRSAGVITINDGTFYGNNAKQGGIISTTGNLTINGGLFDGNTNASNGKVNAGLPQSVATHGGLFYVAKALTITGGEFKAGRVSGSGGIAYVTGSGSVISGGTYTAGGQTNYAGFFRFDGSATITGVTLSGGKATTNGNNIAFGSNGNATLTIGQDAVIDGGIMFRTDKTGNKLVLVGNAQVNSSDAAQYSLNLANATVHIGSVDNAAVATIGATFADYVATYDADGNVTGVAAK